MTNSSDRSPWDLLDRLPLSPVEREFFFRDDSDAVQAKVRILIAAAYYFDAHGVADFGGRGSAVRDRRLVEQVVAAAFSSFGSVDPHPTPIDKAAMLMREIVQGHPFNDGNKRTGFLVTAYYLRIMGFEPPTNYRVEDVIDFCVRVSSGELRDVSLIAQEIQRLWQGAT